MSFETELEVPAVFDQEAWMATLRELASHFQQTQWQIGDMIVQAEPHIPDISGERIYGHTIPASNVYIEAGYATGLSRAVLYDLASTARRCPASVRTERLSWSHHRIIVNNLPNAEEGHLREWLERAAEECLTTRELKRELRRGYRPARLEKRFQVIVPLSVWESMQAFAALRRVRPQKIASEWLAQKVKDSEGERQEVEASVRARRKAQRRRVGLWVARQYNPLRLDCS